MGAIIGFLSFGSFPVCGFSSLVLNPFRQTVAKGKPHDLICMCINPEKDWMVLCFTAI